MSPLLSELGRRTVDPPISWLMKLSLENPGLISLAAGFTDNETLPVDEVREALLTLFKTRKRARNSLQYGSTAGDPELRKRTGDQLLEQDGGVNSGVYSPDRMIITHGSQQFLYTLVESLCDPGDILLVEDPTYFVFLGICQSHGVRCQGIPLQDDGLNIERLRARLEALKRTGDLHRLKMLYLVTYFQNPSSITTSLVKKQAALDLLRHYERAAGHPIYLLEDAAYRDLRFAGPEVASSLTSDKSGERVIYSGTFSKPFATGLRLGFGLMPKTLVPVIQRIKGNHDFGTAHLLQQLLLEAVRSGAYHRHLPTLRARYASKAKTMGEAMRKHFPRSIQWKKPCGGLYFWAQLPDRVRTGFKSKVFKQVLAQDVVYVPGELCYADDETRPKPACEMRLSFASASRPRLREGIKRLGNVLSFLVD